VTLGMVSSMPKVDSEGSTTDAWGTISNLAPAVISYEYLDTRGLVIFGGSGGNIFNVNSTMMGSPGITTIYGGTGSNTFVINGAGLGASSVNNFYGQGTGTNSFTLTSMAPAGVQVNCAASLSDWFSQNLTDPGIQALARTDYNRGKALSRADLLELFDQAGADGVVKGPELHSLQALVANADYLNISDDVRILSSNVVNGNPANANLNTTDGNPKYRDYKGTLGNLAVGSLSSQLNELVDKWFNGADYPSAANVLTNSSTPPWQWVGGQLFSPNPNGPSLPPEPNANDVAQGAVADCYFLSALGAAATQSPDLVRNMFIDNGDGTYTVRFYKNGVPTYVTVDRQLPVVNGQLSFAGKYQYSQTTQPSTGLWVALAEKAYAQLAEQGWTRPTETAANAYATINPGGATYSALALEEISGATSYRIYTYGPSTQQTLIDAFTEGDAITMWVGDHVWMLTGYNPATGNFTFTNPYNNGGRVSSQPDPDARIVKTPWANLSGFMHYFSVVPFYRVTGSEDLQSVVNGVWTSIDHQVLSFAQLADGTLFDLRTTGVLVTQRPESSTWVQLDTGVQAIVQADNSLYDLETNGQLWRYQNGSRGSASIDSGVQSIVVAGDGLLYDLTTTGDLWQYLNGSRVGPAFASSVRTIAVGGDGSLYYLETNGQLWRYQSYQTGTRSLMDSGVQTIAVGGDGSLYDLETNGQLWQYQTYKQSGAWYSIDTGVKAIAVDSCGTLYDLETNGQLWSYLLSTWSNGPIATGITSIYVDPYGNLVKQ
jgi:hypothetical protein